MDEFLFKNELLSSSLRLTHTVRRVRSMKNLYQHMQRHIDEFLSIFNCLDMGIYIVDPVNYSILAANSSAIKILGHNPVGKKCYEVLLKEQPGPCTHCDNELLARGVLQYGSMPWEFKSSANEKWYRCISKILAWSENKFAKMEIIVDITDTKRMERELNLLRVFREKIRSLYHIPVMEFDKKGKIEYTNHACMEFLGLSKEDLADLFVWKFLDDHGKEAWFRLIDEVSMKDSESIECNLFTRERKVETYLNIIYNRDTKGTIIDGMLFIVEKPRKDFVRFY